MKRRIPSLYLLSLILIQSCIKDAPQNPEADIESFVIDKSALEADVFIDQSNRKILLYLKTDAYANGVVPQITLSEGATVSPASGDSLRFNTPVQYVVTSENGVNKKAYDVVVVSAGQWSFNFENWREHGTNKYEYPIESDSSLFWSSGNPGVALSGVTKQVSSYPTRSTADHIQGIMAAELVTLKGTALSELAGVRLFAGSMFTGNFEIQHALAKPLEATQFGQPYAGKALKFTGYYKYTPGTDYQDENGNIISGRSDSCAIYAVVFKGQERLNGTNINSSSQILGRAELTDGSARASWTRFELDFEYVPGADLSGPLMLAIVTSSSKNGGSYRGAIGSRLVVDSLQIIK